MTESEKPDELFNRAQEAFDSEDWATAIGLLRRIISQKPEYPGVQKLLEEALRHQSAQIAYEIGLGYFGERKWPQAIERFDIALRDNPDHSGARAKKEEAEHRARIDRLLGEAEQYRKKSEWEQVVTRLEEVLELNPDAAGVKQQLDDAKVKYLYQAGEQHFKEKHWRVALKYFKDLEQRRPGYKDTSSRLKEIERQLQLEELYRQAREHEQAAEWPGAITLYDQIYKQDPDYGDVVKCLAHCKEQLNLQKKEEQGRQDQGEKGRRGGSQIGEGQDEKRKGPLSRRRQFCCFAGGAILAILIVLFWGRDIRCLLVYGTSDGLISLRRYRITRTLPFQEQLA